MPWATAFLFVPIEFQALHLFSNNSPTLLCFICRPVGGVVLVGGSGVGGSILRHILVAKWPEIAVAAKIQVEEVRVLCKGHLATI